MNISKIIESNPEAIEILIEVGLGCIGCAFSRFETFEEGAKSHGFSDEEIDELIKKINEVK